MHHSRLAADVLHDVDFSALRPSDRVDVLAEHPECRPHPLPGGNLDARLESAVGLREESLCFQTRGSVISRCSVCSRESLFLRSDGKVAALDLRVHRAVSVRLEFLIAPTVFANAQIVSPFG